MATIAFNSHTNLEIIAFLINFYKQSNDTIINFTQSNFVSKLNNDVPFFYTLNQKVNEYISQKINLVLIIGTNLRYEASLLNTILRRKQIQNNLKLLTVNSFNVLNYQQNHSGNTSITLISILQNRLIFIKTEIKKKEGIFLLNGANSSNHKYGIFLQKHF